VIEGTQGDVVFDFVGGLQEIGIVNIVVVQFILILRAHDIAALSLIKVHCQIDSLHIGFNN
jgi:hypothetical protein